MFETIPATAADFHASLASGAPPAGFSTPLLALWWDGRGDWQAAHTTVMAHESDRDAAWVHAYLHRKEGDAGNAAYWYARAGRPVPKQSLADEWGAIVAALIEGDLR